MANQAQEGFFLEKIKHIAHEAFDEKKINTSKALIAGCKK